MNQKVQQLAKMIDHSLLHPTMTDEDLYKGCIVARQYNVASVCIKPYAVEMAVEELEDTDVLVGTVIGFPHGSNTTSIKIAEAEEACNNGAKEIDMVVNIGKVLSEEWAAIEVEIAAINETVLSCDAILKVIFENDFLPDDKYKIMLCEICSRVGVAFVKTSTGYGMVKGPDGKYGYKGATDHDLQLMRAHCAPGIQIKAAGGVRTLDDLLRVQSLGVGRIGASATVAILNEAIQRFGGTIPKITDRATPEGY